MATKNCKKYFTYLYIVFAIFFFLATRLFRLNIIPFGYHYDEAGMAYDAYCLANYGVDRYLNSYPLYLHNYGGGQSVLYVYCCALLIRIFGTVNAWIIRLPAVFFSFLSLVFGFLFAKKINKQGILAYLFPITFIISPVVIACGRLGIDCYLLMGSFAVFSYFLLSAILTIKWYHFVLSGIFGGLLLYSYALSYFILPIFLILFLMICIRTKRITLANIFEIGIPLFFLAFPLILIQIINIFDFPEIVFHGITLTKLLAYRVTEFKPFSFARMSELISTIIKGDGFLFVNPGSFGSFYLFTIPFFAIGFFVSLFRNIKSIIKRVFNPTSIFLIWFVVEFLLFCHLNPISYRLNGLYLPICFFISYGVEILYELITKRSAKVAFAIVATFILFSAVAFLRFAVYYYCGGYSIEAHNMEYFDIDISEGINYVTNDPYLSQKVTQMAEPVVYCYLGMGANPYDYGIINYQRSDNELFTCHSLTDIDKNQNYIVRDLFPDFSQELRDMGFTEKKYTCYSLFYCYE